MPRYFSQEEGLRVVREAIGSNPGLGVQFVNFLSKVQIV